jgi:hypothetical protein
MDASNVCLNGGSRMRSGDHHLPPEARPQDSPSCHIIFEFQLAPSSSREGSCEAVAVEFVSRFAGRS